MDVENNRWINCGVKWAALAICILMVGFGVLNMMYAQKDVFDNSTDRTSVSIINFGVPKEAWPQFFAKLETYAHENGFQYGRSRIHPVKEEFGLLLSRRDVELSAFNTREPFDFEFAFFIDPARGGSQKVVDQVASSLSQEMQTLAGITITKKK
jgi:hypothetical protein